MTEIETATLTLLDTIDHIATREAQVCCDDTTALELIHFLITEFFGDD